MKTWKNVSWNHRINGYGHAAFETQYVVNYYVIYAIISLVPLILSSKKLPSFSTIYLFIFCKAVKAMSQIYVVVDFY